MNKFKFLAATTLCSLFLIGLAGCGDDNPEGSACTEATAENDCASSTETSYVCHTDDTCHVDCTTSEDMCSSTEECVDSRGGKKVCVAKQSQDGGENGDCGGKTCAQGQSCDRTDPNAPVCKDDVAENTYWSILIVDTSEGDACTEKDAGSDIAGVAIKSPDGTVISYYGSSSRKPGTGIQSPYTTHDNLPEGALNPDSDKCVIRGLKDNADKALVLGCGGKAVFQNQVKPESFKTGDQIEIYEYNGNVCYKGDTPPSQQSPDDHYAVYACKSRDASVDPVSKVEIGTDCVLQGENLSGFQNITVK